ncbi:hypothetical protein NHH03_00360 [Stieleria sp. TO1_6]|uniref:hypothetical protein n=1 Tax=Stieleria tagensis TaxID=2956795 RepID=UPI00209AB390|nr:hypothetical protein [Stieleria tagensis]MCO8120172.1 hypothetical protein [Stieleria tagensis]
MIRSLFTLTLITFVAIPASAFDPSEWLSVGGEKSTSPQTNSARNKLDTRELLQRYPVGKTWAASKVLRIRGLAVNENWGIEGRTNVVYTNRYSSKTQVLENELGDLTFQIDVLEASQQRVTSEKRLRVADFSDASPILKIGLEQLLDVTRTTLPPADVAYKLMMTYGKVDPRYEKVLTRLAQASGFDVERLTQIDEAQLVEDPAQYSGCQFEVVWSNGLGVTRVRQTDGPVTVKLDDIRRWAEAADPLLDYYVMDNVNRPVGDTWSVDAGNASGMLVHQQGGQSEGTLKMKYLRDANYDNQTCRQLVIQNGDLTLALDQNAKSYDARVRGIQGRVFYGKSDYLVLQANGTCEIKANVKSKTHLLFGTKWQRDVQTDFRYEAQLIASGQ